MGYFCKFCGEFDCKRHSLCIGKSVKITEFEGSSPPEVFVGKWNYPRVFTGILSPIEFGNTSIMSSHEMWHEKKLPIATILKFRNDLIYGRTQSNIKKPLQPSKFLSTLQEVAMTHKSVAAVYKLKKPVMRNPERESRVPMINNAAPIQSVVLTQNAPVKKKIDQLVSDTEVKSSTAMRELDKAGIATSSIMKILSAGLLGLGRNRKLVPTRWSITATDDMLSKERLARIKRFPVLSEVLVFHAEYVGNNYHFVLLPEPFSFEVIEISLKNFKVWHDHESFFQRRRYAESVTGAYYANRLALSEYLDNCKRQASCVVFREIRPEYYAPLGVGILREISRNAFSKSPVKVSSLDEAGVCIQNNLRIPISHFLERSIVWKGFGKQKRLSEFF